MRTHRTTFIVAAICLILYLIVGGRLRLFGASPAFLVILTACVAVLEGSHAGSISGFLCGLVMDLMGSGALGVQALFLTIFGFILGAVSFREIREGWLRPLIAFVACDVAFSAIILMIEVFKHGFDALNWAVIGSFFGGIAADSLLVLLFFVVISKILERFRLASGALLV